jgi:hypothetical protein
VWCYILFIRLMSFCWGLSVQFYCCIINSVNHLKFFDQIIPFISLQYSSWLAQNCHNISNPLYFKCNRTCLIRHSNGPGKCLGLYRMLVYSGFILVNSYTLGPYIFVDVTGCQKTHISDYNTVYNWDRHWSWSLVSYAQSQSRLTEHGQCKKRVNECS